MFVAATGNIDALQRVAKIESLSSDMCYRVRYIKALQRVTPTVFITSYCSIACE